MATIKKITGNYKILSTDKGKHLLVDSVNPAVITFTATTASIGAEILVTWWNQGDTSFISDSTCNIRSSDNEWALAKRYSHGRFFKVSATEWLFTGEKKSVAQPNLPPTANAGSNAVITLPLNSVTLAGSGNDSDGSIASYSWTKISGPSQFTITNATSAIATVSNLVAGTYIFQLQVTDNLGAVGIATTTVTVNATVPVNQPPISNAGIDKTVTLPFTSVTLSGSGIDGDGTIASYAWSKVSGTGGIISSPNVATTDISGLTAGSYVYNLNVIDNGGLSANDTVVITVLPAVNLVPTVNAGVDQTITLPSNLTLSGTGADSDGTISYLWSRVSGPNVPVIVSPASAKTDITGLTSGNYTFRLTITDNAGAAVSDDVNVTVLSVVIEPPVTGTYYVDGINGLDTNNGTSTTSAWKTINKVNAALVSTIQPGNTVKFRCNQTYYGGINVPRSGNAGAPITFGSWDTGSKPILSGFSTTSWTNLGGSLWESISVSPLTSCNMLTINNLNVPYGRMPKTDFWSISTATPTSIASSNLNSSTINWTGADIVSKTARWHLDRATVSSHSGNTINFSGMAYEPVSGWGFFLQNHVKACTVQNDWCFNATSKKVTIFSSATPSNVKFSTVEIGINLNAYNNIVVENLAFEGYNSYGVFANLSNTVSNSGISVKNCDFDYIGKIGIFTNRRNSVGINVSNNNINEANDGGIHVGNTDNASITDNVIYNAGNLAGMGNSGDESYTGIVCFAGSNCKVYRNHITNSGYIGIRFDGDGTEIVNNTVINTNYIKDDGGGIYCYPNEGDKTITPHSKRRIVKGNIVIGAPGIKEGTPGYSNVEGYCIYNDGNSSDTDFVDNFCYNAAGSVGCFFMNGGYNNVVNNNVFLGGQRGLRSHVVAGITPLSQQYTNNVYVAKESNQFPIYMEFSSIPASWTLIGNRCAKPINDGSAKMWIDKAGVDEYFTLAAYKALSFTGGKDANAANSPIGVSSPTKIVHYYNDTANVKNIDLGSGVYRNVKDGSTKTGTITLQPYTGIVLLNTV